MFAGEKDFADYARHVHFARFLVTLITKQCYITTEVHVVHA